MHVQISYLYSYYIYIYIYIYIYTHTQDYRCLVQACTATYIHVYKHTNTHLYMTKHMPYFDTEPCLDKIPITKYTWIFKSTHLYTCKYAPASLFIHEYMHIYLRYIWLMKDGANFKRDEIDSIWIVVGINGWQKLTWYFSWFY